MAFSDFIMTFDFVFQELYQYIVSREISPPFSLYMAHPRSPLLFNDESLLPYKDALIMVEVEDPVYEQKILDVFMDTTVRSI